jgi:hypothetical protein
VAEELLASQQGFGSMDFSGALCRFLKFACDQLISGISAEHKMPKIKRVYIVFSQHNNT